MNDELLTPAEWCELRGLFILDPDGWRDGTRTWDEPIDESEFRSRFGRCTVRYDAVARNYIHTQDPS